MISPGASAELLFHLHAHLDSGRFVDLVPVLTRRYRVTSYPEVVSADRSRGIAGDNEEHSIGSAREVEIRRIAAGPPAWAFTGDRTGLPNFQL
jgi:hypothetical protein